MTPMLRPEEPAVSYWRAMTPVEFAAALVQRAAPETARAIVIAVDGRSGSGRTTLAESLQSVVPNAATVHTDDAAWHHTFFDWADLIVAGVLEPTHHRDQVSYRPPAWDQRGRAGALEVPAETSMLIVEGVGAGRHELMPWIDAVIWVQSDYAEAERRGVLRDGADAHAAEFWQEWMEQEVPFLASQRPWERAAFIVNGTPAQRPESPGVLYVTDGPCP